MTGEIQSVNVLRSGATFSPLVSVDPFRRGSVSNIHSDWILSGWGGRLKGWQQYCAEQFNKLPLLTKAIRCDSERECEGVATGLKIGRTKWMCSDGMVLRSNVYPLRFAQCLCLRICGPFMNGFVTMSRCEHLISSVILSSIDVRRAGQIKRSSRSGCWVWKEWKLRIINIQFVRKYDDALGSN